MRASGQQQEEGYERVCKSTLCAGCGDPMEMEPRVQPVTAQDEDGSYKFHLSCWSCVGQGLRESWASYSARWDSKKEAEKMQQMAHRPSKQGKKPSGPAEMPALQDKEVKASLRDRVAQALK